MPPKKSYPPDVCVLFVTNDFCHREAGGQCHLIHDWDMLAKYMEEKQAALRPKNPAPATTQEVVAPIVTVLKLKPPTVASKYAVPSIVQEASAPAVLSKPTSPALQAATPAIASKIPTTTTTPTNTVTRPTQANAGISNHSIENTISNPTMTTSPSKPPITTAPVPNNRHVQRRQCKFYINGQYCPFQNRRSGCWDIHDLEARRANLAKRSLANTTQTQKQQNGITVATQTSNHRAQMNFSAITGNPDSTSKLVQEIKAMTITNVLTADSHEASKSDSGRSTTAPPQKNWDTSTEWERWAARNLSGSTASKFIVPYLPALANGTAPLSIFATGLKTAATLPGAATTFPNLGLLPFELRDLVWKFAMAGDKCDCRIRYDYKLDKTGRHLENNFVPMNATPRFMHVNSETRVLALKVYEKTFGTNDYPGTSWFNYEVDRLFLNTSNSAEYLDIIKNMKYADRKRIHILAIPLKDLITGNEKRIMELIALGFKNVWRIDLVAGDGEEDAQWTRDAAQEAKIKTWNKRLWLRVQPNRKVPPPSIRYAILPAHVAHHYKIDGFKW